MEKINLIEQRESLIELATKLFNYATELPYEEKWLKSKEKKSRGIQIFVYELKNKDNLVFNSIGEPSDFAKIFAVQQAVKAEILGHHFASRKEPGVLSVLYKDTSIWASTAGLMEDENAVISLFLLAKVTDCKPGDMIKYILSNKGELPNCFLNVRQHYIYELIDNYKELLKL